MINPYNILHPQGVAGGKTTVLPANYSFDLTTDTWWSATTRARLYSDFTGLDALYNYVMKSSTIVRAAIDKRLRPLRERTFGVFINGKENEALTGKFAASALVRELVYQKGLAKFVFARVVGVNKDLTTYVYPMRNLDFVNRAIKGQTYDFEGKTLVKGHVNLFWMQSPYDSEDTLGLLEPISRDYIDYRSAANNWLTAGQYMAYQQMIMYYENGDTDAMPNAAKQAASRIGLGEVLVAGKITDEATGNVVKELELQNVQGAASADTFRIYKENLDTLAENISVLVLGSSLLLTSAKNTNSERLVRAHLKGFNDICEADARDVQEWLDMPENKEKLAYLLGMPELTGASIRVKPSTYIDTGDIETYTTMFKDMALTPTDTFVRKVGLDLDDVVGYEDSKNAIARSKAVIRLREKNDAKRTVKSVVSEYAKRVFTRGGQRDGDEVE